MLAYSYNENFLYLTTTECQPSPLEIGEFLIPANATLVAVPDFDDNIEYLKFNLENQTWSKFYITIKNDYYRKSDGKYFDKINKFEEDSYTLIPIVINEGDIVYFDDNAQAWAYTQKGDKTKATELKTTQDAKSKEIEERIRAITCFITKNGFKTKIDINEYVKSIFLNGKCYVPFNYFMVDNNNEVLVLSFDECDQVASKISYLSQYIETNIFYNKVSIQKLTSVEDVKNYKETDKDGNILITEEIIAL